jgi:DNA-binding NarL/FixJ family response regulator
MTVLIVDDHPTFRRFARKLLVRSGFTVVGGAVDCASALAAAEQLRPDVILLDVMLPDGRPGGAEHGQSDLEPQRRRSRCGARAGGRLSPEERVQRRRVLVAARRPRWSIGT